MKKRKRNTTDLLREWKLCTKVRMNQTEFSVHIADGCLG